MQRNRSLDEERRNASKFINEDYTNESLFAVGESASCMSQKMDKVTCSILECLCRHLTSFLSPLQGITLPTKKNNSLSIVNAKNTKKNDVERRPQFNAVLYLLPVVDTWLKLISASLFFAPGLTFSGFLAFLCNFHVSWLSFLRYVVSFSTISSLRFAIQKLSASSF